MQGGARQWNNGCALSWPPDGPWDFSLPGPGGCKMHGGGRGKAAMSPLSLGDTTVKERLRYTFYFTINHRIKKRGWVSQELSPVLPFSLENASPSSEKHFTVPTLWTLHSMHQMYWRINSTAEQSIVQTMEQTVLSFNPGSYHVLFYILC